MPNRKGLYSKVSDYFLLLPSLIPLFLIFVYPLLYGISLSFQEVGRQGWSLSNYIRFFENREFYDTIYRTLILVLPASIVQLIIAFAMAYFLRQKIKGKFILQTLIIFPLTLGSIIIAAGMISFFSPRGWLNQAILGLGLIDDPLRLLYNYWGTFIALCILGTAFLFSNFIGLMEKFDSNLELVARSLGANELTTFRQIFLPLVQSGVLSIYSLSLVIQLAVYPSAVLVGNPAHDTRVFSVVAFEQAKLHFNYNMAITIAVVMTVTQLICLRIVSFIRKKGYTGYAGTFK